MSASQARSRAGELLETVGLTPASQFAAKLPHQLSGGQRQRVLIARALACDPGLVVADEPVSMLDVSLRAGILELLAELRGQRGLSLLYITHDLLSARVITGELLVLYQGRIVEQGPTKQVLQNPQHSYTVQLLDAVANPFAAAASARPTGIPSTDRSTS
jgi:ABC-type oligopeptide transport system ATPase subunit